ncbi:MAG: STAS domain-containing protein [Fibromonadaceae bacterium]|jgi:anti-anti-sigma factor|nr:STAS domain-containing protein [Fibromonadaceae bacterium]
MAECTIEDKGGYYQISGFDFEVGDFHNIFAKIESALKAKKQDVLLSLAPVGVLYSSHLAIFVRIHQMMHRNNLHFIISDVSPEIMNLLQITQLDSIFSIYKTSEDFQSSLKNSENGLSKSAQSFEWQLKKNDHESADIICKGNMIAGEQLDELQKSVIDFFSITFDFSDLQSMDSSAITFLDRIADKQSISIKGASDQLVEQFRQKFIYGKVKLI